MTLQVSRRQYVDWVKARWADKTSIAELLADSADTLGRKCPPISSQVIHNLLVRLGVAIKRAEKPEECVEAFFEMLRHRACPEPGWNGMALEITD